MATGFRIYGDELGRTGSYVDVDVTGADADGRIEVVESGGSETWTLSPEEIQRLFEDNLAVEASKVPNKSDPMWGSLDSISSKRQNQPKKNFANNRLKDAGKSIFQSLILASQ